MLLWCASVDNRMEYRNSGRKQYYKDNRLITRQSKAKTVTITNTNTPISACINKLRNPAHSLGLYLNIQARLHAYGNTIAIMVACCCQRIKRVCMSILEFLTTQHRSTSRLSKPHLILLYYSGLILSNRGKWSRDMDCAGISHSLTFDSCEHDDGRMRRGHRVKRGGQMMPP